MPKYAKKAGSYVRKAVSKLKKNKLEIGRSKKPVKSRKQAIAIGLSTARKKGVKVPRKNKNEDL